MRQADINRVNKAKEHLKAANTILSNIKWENVNNIEDNLIYQAKLTINGAKDLLNDVTNIQDKEI